MRNPLDLSASLTQTHAALSTIFRLRTVALIGQASAVFGAHQLLGIQLAWQSMWVLWLTLASINVYTAWRLSSKRTVSQAELTTQLIADVTALTLQLMLSDGLSNPFVLFYCLLVAVAAVLLTTSGALLIGLLSLFGLVANALYAVPMRWPAELDASFWQRVGTFVALTLCLSMLAGFVIELSRQARLRDRALALTRETMLRKERVVALGALAAGAAHELGTPLGTMSLLAEEIAATATGVHAQQQREDARLLSAQITRCKEILGRLTSTARDALEARPVKQIDGGAWAEGTVHDYELLYPGTAISYKESAEAHRLMISDEPLYTQALITLLDNARALAASRINISVSAPADHLIVEVEDDGPGFAAEVLEHFAEPFVTQREGGRGLGLFLARTAIESLGGSLSARNLQRGACVTLSLPSAARQALAGQDV